MRYRVTWTIDKDASSAHEAACFAREIQEQAQNTATVFRVQEDRGDVGVLIDVGEPDTHTNYHCYVTPLSQDGAA